MPTTYAHYRFGNDVLPLLPDSVKTEILQNKSLFDIGLHGPDILFYYKALSHNPVSSHGQQMHHQSGRTFLEPLQDILTSDTLLPGSLSYLYGFITHFILDTYCHPYVFEVESQTSLSHAEIEADFDRLLLSEDNHNPIRHNLTGHLNPTVQDTKVISQFYPDIISPEVMMITLTSMKKILDFLVAPSKGKRFLINQALRISGKYDGMHGLVINYEPNPLLISPCATLREIYHDSLPRCVQAIQNYHNFMLHQTALSDVFERTFEKE